MCERLHVSPPDKKLNNQVTHFIDLPRPEDGHFVGNLIHPRLVPHWTAQTPINIIIACDHISRLIA